MLNRNKKADLLEYENFLAENADIICVICESMGSAVELGAFVQNPKIRDKMVVVINTLLARSFHLVFALQISQFLPEDFHTLQRHGLVNILPYRERGLSGLLL